MSDIIEEKVVLDCLVLDKTDEDFQISSCEVDLTKVDDESLIRALSKLDNINEDALWDILDPEQEYIHQDDIEEKPFKSDNLYDQEKMLILEELFNKYNLEELKQLKNDTDK